MNGLLEEVRKAEAEAAKEKKKGAQEVSGALLVVLMQFAVCGVIVVV